MRQTFHLPCTYVTSLPSLVQLYCLFPGSTYILPFSLWNNKSLPRPYFLLILSISNGLPEFFRPTPKETARTFFPSLPYALHCPANASSTRHHILIFLYSINHPRINDPYFPLWCVFPIYFFPPDLSKPFQLAPPCQRTYVRIFDQSLSNVSLPPSHYSLPQKIQVSLFLNYPRSPCPFIPHFYRISCVVPLRYVPLFYHRLFWRTSLFPAFSHSPLSFPCVSDRSH